MADMDFRALQDFFAADDLEWRLQQAGEKNNKVWAICVPYVTNRAIMQRLDDTVGPANWRNEFKAGPGGGVLCGISVRVDGEWVTKWDGAENTDIEGVKGGLSGAMKRAAVQWGIGRYLYALEESFANVSAGGKKRGKLPEKAGGKTFKWDPPALPAWALPRKQEGNGSRGTGGGASSELVGVSDEHTAMLRYIQEVGPLVAEDHEFTVRGKGKRNLRGWIREHWSDIKEQPRMARTAVEEVEAATGRKFGEG